MFEEFTMKITFVCTGNTCRSPMAEAILTDLVQKNKMDIDVISRGLSVYESETINPKASQALCNMGINGFTHVSKQIDFEDVLTSDLILTMTQQHKATLSKAYDEEKYKIFTLLEYISNSKDDISDPYGKSQIFYNFCSEELKKYIDILFEELKEQVND